MYTRQPTQAKLVDCPEPVLVADTECVVWRGSERQLQSTKSPIIKGRNGL